MNQSISKKANTKPRIWFLTEAFYPPIVGGLEKFAYQLTKGLISKEQDLFVITRQTEPASADFERVGNVLIRRVSPPGLLKGKGWKALGPILLLLVRVLYLLIKNVHRYDIIMLIGFKTISIPAMLVSIVCRKKCIIIIQSPNELWEDISAESLRKMNLSQSSILLKLLRSIRNPLIKRADCFVAISSEIKRELIDVGVDPQKIRAIPNGIDTNKFSSVSIHEKLRIRHKLSLPTDKIIFTFTGRLALSKGVLLLIQVWKELVQKYKGIHLLFVGSGKGYSFDSCEDELRDYIKVHELEQSVSITGAVDNVHEYLQASDVFVFPTEYEGFSLALVEALACGLPSVVTRVGGAPELIQNYENGILVNPKNHQEMQTAMEWLIDHKNLWTDIGANARKSVVEKYSIDAVADKYIEMFIELERSEKEGI